MGKARVKFLFECLEDLDRNLKALGSQLYLFEGNSTDVIQELTRQLVQKGDRPKLFFNYDVQVQYGIERDHQIIPLLSLWENLAALRRFSLRKIKLSTQFDKRGL